MGASSSRIKILRPSSEPAAGSVGSVDTGAITRQARLSCNLNVATML